MKAGLGAFCGVLLAAHAINLVLHLAASTSVETVWNHLDWFLRGIQHSDSWKPMEMARDYAARHASGLYEDIFFVQRAKFQYPPTSLLLFGSLQRPALNVLSWLATAATAALVAAVLRTSVQQTWGPLAPGRGAALTAIAVAAALTFYPNLKAYTLGQIQTWLNLFFAAMVLAWMHRLRVMSGAALAVICLIKPTVGLLFVWGSLRREWRFVATGAMLLTGALAISVWTYGFADHLDYLRVLSHIGQRGETFYPNQSFNGVINRLVHNGPSLEWQPHDFAPLHPVVWFVTTASFVVLAAAALRGPARHANSALDLSVAALAFTIAAPIAWEHHYGILLTVYAAVTPVLIHDRPFGRWTTPLLALSYVTAANYYQFTNRFAETWLNPLQSYLFAAAFLLWILMYCTGHRRSSDTALTPSW